MTQVGVSLRQQGHDLGIVIDLSAELADGDATRVSGLSRELFDVLTSRRRSR